MENYEIKIPFIFINEKKKINIFKNFYNGNIKIINEINCPVVASWEDKNSNSINNIGDIFKNIDNLFYSQQAESYQKDIIEKEKKQKIECRYYDNKFWYKVLIPNIQVDFIEKTNSVIFESLHKEKIKDFFEKNYSLFFERLMNKSFELDISNLGKEKTSNFVIGEKELKDMIRILENYVSKSFEKINHIIGFYDKREYLKDFCYANEKDNSSLYRFIMNTTDRNFDKLSIDKQILKNDLSAEDNKKIKDMEKLYKKVENEFIIVNNELWMSGIEPFFVFNVYNNEEENKIRKGYVSNNIGELIFLNREAKKNIFSITEISDEDIINKNKIIIKDSSVFNKDTNYYFILKYFIDALCFYKKSIYNRKDLLEEYNKMKFEFHNVLLNGKYIEVINFINDNLIKIETIESNISERDRNEYKKNIMNIEKFLNNFMENEKYKNIYEYDNILEIKK